MEVMSRCLPLLAALTGLSAHATTDPFCTTPAGVPTLPNPVMFVTQMPIPNDFATIGSVFANHRAGLRGVGRGGDLYIRYPTGKLCNLTREGGFGVDGFQGADGIAVRDPVVHWSGTRALFSMVIGAPEQQFQGGEYYWQLYEVTGLAEGQTVTITKLANQPADFNNVMPAYGSDDRVIFVSDRPRNGARHLYPQHDEYESTPTNTGLWSLDPATGHLFLLQHAPSGSFDPVVDSFGRIIFSRWDHLQRDQQADADAGGGTFGTFDFANESEGATRTVNRVEVFPEPRSQRDDLLDGTNLSGHNINHFFPWMLNQDGSGEETLNHIGRHELHTFFSGLFVPQFDPNVRDFIAAISGRVNPNRLFNMLHIREDPTQPGRFVGVDAPEFQTHAAGLLAAFSAAPTDSADQIVVEYLTHPDTGTVVGEQDTPSADHSGHYRNPVFLSNGSLLSIHAAETRRAQNQGTRANPDPRYDFQIMTLADAGNGFLEASQSVTGGVIRQVSYFDPDVLVSYSGPMWELNPVEVVVQTPPPLLVEGNLAPPEQAVFDDVGVDVGEFRQFLRDENLAVMVARNVTSRDDADGQQPFNLSVPGGVSSIPAGGAVYDVAHLQYFQGDQVRGIGGIDDPNPGRRVLARVLHDDGPAEWNLPNPDGPAGSVAIAPDGSTAAFVPTRRAMAWQTTEPDGTPVIRERYWITFQPGEIRLCDGCHGVNELNHDGLGPSQNEPEALRVLIQAWQTEINERLFKDGFE